MAFETTSNCGTPSPEMSIDEGQLLEYLRRHVPGFEGVRRLSIFQYNHGQSNPTYLVKTGSAKYVLRKKPPGHLLPSAHRIEREYEALMALQDTPVPVPRMACFCEADSVIGTPFYLMEHIQGTIFIDPNLPSLSHRQRHEVYWQMAVTLAALHSVKPSSVGLSTYGHPEGYCRRQVKRWWQQYIAAVDGSPRKPVMLLKEWLESNVPQDDGTPKEGHLTHGDFRLDNLIFATGGELHVEAILDWELCTLGDPWADVAYSCMPYYMPQVPHLPRLSTPYAKGIPTQEEYINWYCRIRGVEKPSQRQFIFYTALGLFRLAAILQGVGARARQGNAVSKMSEVTGSPQVVNGLAERALEMISSGTAPPPPVGGDLSIPHASCTGTGFDPSPRVKSLASRLRRFMAEKVVPAEDALEAHANSADRWSFPPILQSLKEAAKREALWNLWLPADTAVEIREVVSRVCGPKETDVLLGCGLTNLEYAHLCGIMGASVWAPEVFNCSAPDTGNMELLARFGSPEQQREWLLPLLDGSIRSCFAMTEKAVASSDATNIQSTIRLDGDSYVLSGRKWWISGATHPLCRVCIFMGKTDLSASTYRQQSMVLVPMDTPGVRVLRPMLVFGYDDAPVGHAEIDFAGVRVPKKNLVCQEGRGFEMAQSRLGPGRLHHCMRLIGMADRAMELMVDRVRQRTAFGGTLAENPAVQMGLAKARMELEAARLMVFAASDALDKVGIKEARHTISATKVAVPQAVGKILDSAIQLHGGTGLSDDTPLARLWIQSRALRIADGPDEVHLLSIAKAELKRARL